MFWLSLAHWGIQWFTATFLRKTGAPEYWREVVLFSQVEHLKCLAKETLLLNAIVYFRLIYNNLSDSEILKTAF